MDNIEIAHESLGFFYYFFSKLKKPLQMGHEVESVSKFV